MAYHDTDDPIVKAWMTRFGAAIRDARKSAGLSQAGLAQRGLVPQSFVSRVEHGLVPYTALVRVARLSIGMEGRIPVGPCPHRHDCAWSDPLITPMEFAAYHRRRDARLHGVIDRRQLALVDGLEAETG